jgi:hypothetical protein
MIDLVFQSFWLWYTAGVVLWAFIGVLIASWYRLPGTVGAVVGAFFWFVGVAGLLLVGVVRSSRTRQVRTAAPWGSAASSALGETHAPQWLTPSIASQRMPTADPWAPASSVDPWSVAPTSSLWAEPSSSGPGAVPSRLPRDRINFSRTNFVSAVAVLGALGIFVSVALPWGRGDVIWSHGGQHQVGGEVSPGSTGFVAFVLIATGLVVVCAVSLSRWRLHPAWPAIAAIAVTWWFCLGLEWLLIESHTASAAGTGDAAVFGDHGSASVSTSVGLWVMLGACCVVYGWCVAVSSPIICGASGNRVSSSADMT